MPLNYPGPFLRLTAIGTIFSVETFNWTLSLVPNFQGTVGAINLVPTAIADAVEAFHRAVPGSPSANLQQLKMARIGTDGKYMDDAPAVHDYGAAGIPGQNFGTSRLPAQAAIAITLRSTASRGLANSGRFYIPAMGAALENVDGLMTQANALSIANSAATMINAIDAAGEGQWVVGIASGGGVNSTAGAFRRVDTVEVGRVVDTIRSRRRNLPETYVATTQAVGATG
jgi:hypothetical protein